MITHENILEQYVTLEGDSDGAQIKAVDLHIHTPGSKQDYKIAGKLYEHTTIEEIKCLAINEGLATEQQLNLMPSLDKDMIVAELIIHCAIKKELSLIAITDHNTFCWYEKIMNAYDSYMTRTKSIWSLTILPGIEITAFGGNHVIGIFEAKGYLKAWNSLMYQLHIDDDFQGIDGPICTKSELDIVEYIYNLDGVTYIPHIDTRSEKLGDMLDNLSGKSKIKLLQNPKLLALGFSNYDRHLIVESELKNKKGKYFRKVPLAYLRDSDAHDPSEIGTKPIYLKLDQNNFLSLKFALQDPEQRVLSNKHSNTKSKEVLGLAIKDGWFKKTKKMWQYFRFNSDLNCIIGGRGTGKSTIVNVVMAIVKQRARNGSERDFISQFSNILLYLLIDTKVFCISLEPRIMIDSYTGERIDHENRLRTLSIENWIMIYEIKNNMVVKVPISQTQYILESIRIEYFSQNEIAQISTNQEKLLNLFDKIVSMYTDEMFMDLIKRKNDIVLQIRDLAFNITNANALAKVDLLNQRYQELFHEVHYRRQQTAGSLNSILENNISIAIGKLPITESYYAVFDGFCDRLFLGHYEVERAELIINNICSKIEPLNLVKLIVNKQYRSILEVCNVPKWEPKSYSEVIETKIDDFEIIEKIAGIIKSSVPRLLTLLDEDSVNILFNCGQHVGAKAFKKMDFLSFGQKAVVILTLITNLGENHGMPPLIIDQPEDHLDNHYIFSNLVTDLRKIKGKRQVILVTHNPNIVVSGDAEQVICLASDGTCGWVEIAGSIDRPKIQNFIVETLEGGKQALGIRIKKYTNFNSYT